MPEQSEAAKPLVGQMQRFQVKPSRKAKAEPPKPTAIVPKTTYHGFCGTCATEAPKRFVMVKALTLPARQIGHACLFAEQGNRVRIPDTERSQPIGFAGSESGRNAIGAGPGGRLPKVAVFLKHCFPYGVIRAR